MMDTSQEPLSRQERVLMMWAKVANAHIEAAGMTAENTFREMQGHTIAYDYAAFVSLSKGLDPESVERYIRTGK